MIPSAVVSMMVAVLASLAMPSIALGQGSDASRAEALRCVEAFEASQELRQRDKLVEAREQLRVCGRDICPGVVRSRCTSWLDEASATIPSVVFQVQSVKGTDIMNAKVFLDGGTDPIPSDGTALSLNPGRHSVRVEAEGFRDEELTFVAHAGERLRAVEVVLSPLESDPPPATKEAPDSSAPAMTYVLAGVGVVGAGSFAYFGATARADDVALSDCSPECSPDQIDSIRDRYLIANISLGVATVALGAAAYLYFTSGSDAPEDEALDAGARSKRRQAPRIFAGASLGPARPEVTLGVNF